MGAYLSAPNTEKSSSNYGNEFLDVGASSMQGWRITQEDSHNCILDFDASTSLFSVYDGHGGAEVAIYCAERLPAFLKELASYKTGDFEQALKDAFLGFDKTLLEEDVIKELKRLAEKNPNRDSDGAEDEEEEDLMELCQEGSLPLAQVLEKYKGAAAKFPHLDKLKQDDAGASGSGVAKPQSPFLRGRRNLNETQSKLEAAVGFAVDSGCGPSSSTTPLTGLSPKGLGASMPDLGIGDSIVSSSCGKSDISLANSSVAAEQPEILSSRKLVETCEAVSMSDTNGTVSPTGVADSSSSDAIRSSESEAGMAVKTKVQNGDITSSSSAEAKQWKGEGNGEVSSNTRPVKAQPDMAAVGDGVARPKVGSVSSGISSSTSSEAAGGLVAKVKSQASGAVEESSSDDDADFHAAEEENSTTEDGEEDCEPFEEESDGEDEDEETDDDEEGLVDDDDSAFCRYMIEEPGKDSGCTAVVALINGRDLYVANAGDSRCVVCRNGKAVEMSLDHKPEDDEETERIQKAGGKVTLDGRVNGGLNLSRAIGDHAYKMNQELPPEKQMISALPDVRKLIISPEDEFMVLACDGIWNFMSSEEVVDFVKKRLLEGCDKLSQICEELFDHCLAPNTMGDGTGCDNMTAVLVCFKPALQNLFTKIPIESEATSAEPTSAKKRNAPVSSNSDAASSSPDNESSSSDGLDDDSPPAAKKRPASPTRSDEAAISSGDAEPSDSSNTGSARKRLKTDDNEVSVADSADSFTADAAVLQDEDAPMSTGAHLPASSSEAIAGAPATDVESSKESIAPSTSSTT